MLKATITPQMADLIVKSPITDVKFLNADVSLGSDVSTPLTNVIVVVNDIKVANAIDSLLLRPLIWTQAA